MTTVLRRIIFFWKGLTNMQPASTCDKHIKSIPKPVETRSQSAGRACICGWWWEVSWSSCKISSNLQTEALRPGLLRYLLFWPWGRSHLLSLQGAKEAEDEGKSHWGVAKSERGFLMLFHVMSCYLYEIWKNLREWGSLDSAKDLLEPAHDWLHPIIQSVGISANTPIPTSCNFANRQIN